MCIVLVVATIAANTRRGRRCKDGLNSCSDCFSDGRTVYYPVLMMMGYIITEVTWLWLECWLAGVRHRHFWLIMFSMRHRHGFVYDLALHKFDWLIDWLTDWLSGARPELECVPSTSHTATSARRVDSRNVCRWAWTKTVGETPHHSLRGAAVERRSLTGQLSLRYARPTTDGWPLMWV